MDDTNVKEEPHVDVPAAEQPAANPQPTEKPEATTDTGATTEAPAAPPNPETPTEQTGQTDAAVTDAEAPAAKEEMPITYSTYTGNSFVLVVKHEMTLGDLLTCTLLAFLVVVQLIIFFHRLIMGGR